MQYMPAKPAIRMKFLPCLYLLLEDTRCQNVCPTPACSFLQDIFPTAKLMQFFVARKYNTANQCC